MGGFGSGGWYRYGTKSTTASYTALSIADLRRRHRLRRGGALELEGETVRLTWTPCHYGGERAWFVCPRCSGRRGVLYLFRQGRGVFAACRSCLGLSYATQNMGRLDRAIERASKIRVRLGGTPGIVDPFPPKPRGMHFRTYYRLMLKARAAEGRAWGISRAWLDAQQRDLSGLERAMRAT